MVIRTLMCEFFWACCPGLILVLFVLWSGLNQLCRIYIISSNLFTSLILQRSRCSFSMMAKWANYGKCSLIMMVKCLSIMVKWVCDHILISSSLTSISPSLTIILSLAITKRLHRLQCRQKGSIYFPYKSHKTRLSRSQLDSKDDLDFYPNLLKNSFYDHRL